MISLTDSALSAVYTLVSISAAIAKWVAGNRKFDRIPTVGSDSWLGSWWGGYKFHELVQEGYEKYKSAPFKVADRYRWFVVLGGSRHIEELRKASEDCLSSHDATNDLVQMKYTMGKESDPNEYPVVCIRSQLTRNLVTLYPEIHHEISVALDEVLGLPQNGWKSVPALSTILNVVCRTSNRLFVGLPLCRDPDWIDLNIQYTLDVMHAAKEIRRFPGFLAPFVAYFVTGFPDAMKRGLKHLSPIIEERLKLLKEYGNSWPDKPNDFLSWLLDEAPDGPERTARLLTMNVLGVNFAAIHTSANSFFHALCLLAENPQYMQSLREEVDAIAAKEGWSKASLGKMYKVDSFLKESQRFVGIGSVSMIRIARKDFTFSDGTVIPKGTQVGVPSAAMHHDEEHYEDAHVFNPFRFSDMRRKAGEVTKHSFVSTNPTYLLFGHGKKACPGRFFASNELKSMLAHIVATYDVKLEDNASRPKEIRVGVHIVGDPTANVMFRRRAQ